MFRHCEANRRFAEAIQKPKRIAPRSSLRENPQDFRGNPNHANLKDK
ncbi:hypothetical protein [Helicobacter sp. 23-1045]